jgi:hypothetical protein
MGYNIFILETDFRVTNENTDLVLAAVKRLCQTQRIVSLNDKTFASANQNLAFVKNESVVNASNIYDALSELRWSPHLDDEDNIENLEFTGEKLGDEQLLFDVIAAFVEDNSYIVVAGDDGKVWRWRFDGGKCHYELGKVVF